MVIGSMVRGKGVRGKRGLGSGLRLGSGLELGLAILIRAVKETYDTMH